MHITALNSNSVGKKMVMDMMDGSLEKNERKKTNAGMKGESRGEWELEREQEEGDGDEERE